MIQEIAPPIEPTDTPFGTAQTHKSTTEIPDDSTRNDREVLREPSPGLLTDSPFVIRLAFTSSIKPEARGFEFGDGPRSNIRVPFHGKASYLEKAYFRIHYNFSSGALLMTAQCELRVGSTKLDDGQSLLLMPGMIIRFGKMVDLVVEFPDTSNCTEEHEREYRDYSSKVGVRGAVYLPTPRTPWDMIGAEHRVVHGGIGAGGFGTVHKVVNTKDGRALALKVLKGDGKRELAEVDILKDLSHENIIKYDRAFTTSTGQVCIAMELAVNDLHHQLEARASSKGKRGLSMEAVRSIGRQALSALSYLHGQDVMHRDLKPANILVTYWNHETDTPTIKLADFGLAGKGSAKQSYVGTKGYVAPEIKEVFRLIQMQKQMEEQGMIVTPAKHKITYTNAVDIWAMGKILDELLTRTPDQIKRHRGLIPAFKRPAERLIEWMMQEDPKKRPSASQCLEDPWLADSSSHTPQVQKRNRPHPEPAAIESSKASSSEEGPAKKAIKTALLGFSKFPGRAETDLLLEACMGSNVNLESSSAARAGMGATFNQETINRLVQGNSPAVNLPSFNPPSMNDLSLGILTALEAQGYGNNVVVDGSPTNSGMVRQHLSRQEITTLRLKEDPEGSVRLSVQSRNFFDQAISEAERGGITAAHQDIPPIQLSHILFGPPRPAGGEKSARVRSRESAGSEKGMTFPSEYDDDCGGASVP